MCVCSRDYVTILCHDAKFINALEVISNMYSVTVVLIECRSSAWALKQHVFVRGLVSAVGLTGVIVLCFYGKVKTQSKR